MKTTLFLIAFLLTGCLAPAQVITKQINPSKDTVINKEQAKSFDKNVKIISVQNDSIAIYKKRIHEAVQSDLFGGVKSIHYFFAFIFALMAMFIKWGFSLSKTIKANTDTTVKFSWQLWGISSLHKIVRVIASVFLVFIFLRFSQEMLGFAFSMFIAVLIGFFFDFLADKFMQLKPDTIFKKTTPVV